MSLMCGCDVDWDPEPGDWYWNGVRGYAPLPFKRRRRCCSCGDRIEIGALAVEHTRVKIPDDDVEVSIYGEDGEVPLASDWMCEKCGDLYFSLSDLGYCVNPQDNMHEVLREYVFLARTNQGR